jgi:hypothetical protein
VCQATAAGRGGQETATCGIVEEGEGHWIGMLDRVTWRHVCDMLLMEP